MATGGDLGILSPCQIVRLGAVISTDDMEAIAEGYMNITDETIKNLRYENRGKAQAFNRAVIKQWANMNPKHQVQVRVFVFFILLIQRNLL